MARGQASTASLTRRTPDEEAFGAELKDQLDRENARIIVGYHPLTPMSTAEHWAALRYLAPMLLQARLRPRATRNVLILLLPVVVHYQRVGLELSPDRLLSRATIEEYLAGEGRRHTPDVRKNVVQAAGQLGRALHLAEYPPKFPGYPASVWNLPYDLSDWQAFIDRANRMRRETHAEETCALIDLCFAAGARRPQLERIRGTDISETRGLVRVTMTVKGEVQHRPLGGRPAERTLAFARQRGSAYLFRPDGRGDRPHAIQRVLEQLQKATGVRFQIGRAAASWELRMVQAAGIRAPFDILGIGAKGHTVMRLADECPRSDPREREAILMRMLGDYKDVP